MEGHRRAKGGIYWNLLFSKCREQTIGSCVMAELVRLSCDGNDILILLPTCGSMPAFYPLTPGPQDIRLSMIEAGWEGLREHLNVH